jgi:hypothetical protein
VEKQLNELGIGSLAEWDVLAFINSHGTSIASAENISRLLGYSKASVGAALDSLTSAGLIQRSRNSNGVRIYQPAALEGDLRQRALHELMQMGEGRDGRLLLIKHLGQNVTRNPLSLRKGMTS